MFLDLCCCSGQWWDSCLWTGTAGLRNCLAWRLAERIAEIPPCSVNRCSSDSDRKCLCKRCLCRGAAPWSLSRCWRFGQLASVGELPCPHLPPPLPQAGTCRREDRGHALSFPSWPLQPALPEHLQDEELPNGSTDAASSFLQVALQSSISLAVFYFCSWSRWSCDQIGCYHLYPSRLQACLLHREGSWSTRQHRQWRLGSPGHRIRGHSCKEKCD